MIALGAMVLICAQINRASGEYQRKLDRLLFFIGGVEIFGAALFTLESTSMEFMHSRDFYRAVASGFPIILIALMRFENRNGRRPRWRRFTPCGFFIVPVDLPAVSARSRSSVRSTSTSRT